MSKIVNNQFIKEIKTLLKSARNKVYQNINEIMTKTYFEIGKKNSRRRTKRKKQSRIWQKPFKNIIN